MEFFSLNNINLYIAIALSVINGVLMCFAAYKFLQIFQLSGYKLKGYFSWLKDTKAKYVSRMILLSLLSLFCLVVTNALFDAYHEQELYSYIGLIFYFYFTIVLIVNIYQSPKKIPLKNTKRMARLNVAMFIFVAAFSFFIIALSTEYLQFIRFGALCLVPLAIPIIVPVVHIILVPLENLIIKSYISKAKYNLKKHPNLIKIGITGSYAKTSTKYILNTILSTKYKVCMSPHSFNTPTGLSKVVNNYLSNDDQILIAEMGAKNVGDIKKLCKFIQPKYGILTGVGNQHLMTFKTVENVLKTKNELIESLPEDGYAIFNGNSEACKTLFEQCKVKKDIVSSNLKTSKIKAENIKINEDGTAFDLIINTKKYTCKTSLLGTHNVENILLCVQMAKKLNLTDEEIVSGISSLQQIPHRLEKIVTESNIILDDAYNASVEGSTVALDVLSTFKGRKIVITPGLIELGDKLKEENVNFGKKIAKVADIVVIVNKLNFEAIKEGLDFEKFNDDNIYQAENLNHAKVLLKDFVKKDDVILFENDLPDNYI